MRAYGGLRALIVVVLNRYIAKNIVVNHKKRVAAVEVKLLSYNAHLS